MSMNASAAVAADEPGIKPKPGQVLHNTTSSSRVIFQSAGSFQCSVFSGFFGNLNRRPDGKGEVLIQVSQEKGRGATTDGPDFHG